MSISSNTALKITVQPLSTYIRFHCPNLTEQEAIPKSPLLAELKGTPNCYPVQFLFKLCFSHLPSPSFHLSPFFSALPLSLALLPLVPDKGHLLAVNCPLHSNGNFMCVCPGLACAFADFRLFGACSLTAPTNLAH